jgi:hypothetical protein
MKPPKG